MPKIFVHALEGMPDDPHNFTGNSERDIRVRWLVTDPEGAPVGTGPWRVKSIDTTMIVLECNLALPPGKHTTRRTGALKPRWDRWGRTVQSTHLC